MTPILPPVGPETFMLLGWHEPLLGVWRVSSLEGFCIDSPIGALEAAEQLAQNLLPDGYVLHAVEGHPDTWILSTTHPERKAA